MCVLLSLLLQSWSKHAKLVFVQGDEWKDGTLIHILPRPPPPSPKGTALANLCHWIQCPWLLNIICGAVFESKLLLNYATKLKLYKVYHSWDGPTVHVYITTTKRMPESHKTRDWARERERGGSMWTSRLGKHVNYFLHVVLHNNFSLNISHKAPAYSLPSIADTSATSGITDLTHFCKVGQSEVTHFFTRLSPLLELMCTKNSKLQ